MATGVLAFDQTMDFNLTDAGSVWLSKFDVINGTVYQRLHVAFDETVRFDATFPYNKVCYKVLVRDTVGIVRDTVWVNMANKDPPHPSGYSPLSMPTVRCWDLVPSFI